uniref:Uncharacterized protein n=1 Tax=Anguilla anguilla TaxID=7936 RepID=A0A0E9PSE9_ANGAN
MLLSAPRTAGENSHLCPKPAIIRRVYCFSPSNSTAFSQR